MLDFTADAATIPTPPAITAAAGFVASATARLDAANATLAEAEAAGQRARARVAALEQERQAITARRAGGTHEDGDAGRLALIAADTEGLAPLVAEAQAVASVARQKAEVEQRLVANARQQLARAEDEAVLAALTDHARRLDTLLVTTLTEARQVYLRLGVGKPPFAPSPALVLEIRKVAAAHGLL